MSRSEETPTVIGQESTSLEVKWTRNRRRMEITSSWRTIPEKGVPVYDQKAPSQSINIKNVDIRRRGSGGLDDEEEGSGEEDDDPDIISIAVWLSSWCAQT